MTHSDRISFFRQILPESHSHIVECCDASLVYHDLPQSVNVEQGRIGHQMKRGMDEEVLQPCGGSSAVQEVLCVGRMNCFDLQSHRGSS